MVANPLDYYSGRLLLKLRARLSIYHKLYLSLPKVNDGFTKKMRFTVITLCPSCQAANHVEHFEVRKPGKKKCRECRNTRVFASVTEIFSIHAPIGTQHGTRVNIPDEGNFGPEGVRGDIVVTFLDEPHEHFLRVQDDIIVCFRISYEESVNCVVRLLHVLVPHYQEIMFMSEDGDVIKNNDIRCIPAMGLPNFNNLRRGRLIIMFLVTTRGSMYPVKLKNLLIDGKSLQKNLAVSTSKDEGENDITVVPAVEPENGATLLPTDELERSTIELSNDATCSKYVSEMPATDSPGLISDDDSRGPHSESTNRKYRSRRCKKSPPQSYPLPHCSKMDTPSTSYRLSEAAREEEEEEEDDDGEEEIQPVIEYSDSESDHEKDSPGAKTPSPFSSFDEFLAHSKAHQDLFVEDRLKPSELDKYRLENVDLTKIAYLDRLTLTGAIPMPYHSEVSHPIPMAELELLRHKKYHASWWDKISKGMSVPTDIDEVLREYFPPQDFRDYGKARNSLRMLPVFSIADESLNEPVEAIQTIRTENNQFSPDVPKFTLRKLSRDDRWKLLVKVRNAKIWAEN